jgi:hypothetical protein
MSDEVTWKAVGKVLLGRWPGQVASWGQEGISSFVMELQADGLTPELAVRALRAHASDYAPSAASVSRLAERVVQGPPPTFEQVQKEIASRLSMLPSVAGRESAKAAWPAFIARLAEHHEITARYAQALGPKGVRDMPDPRHAHGAAVEAGRRELGRAVKEWDADPRRGLAAADAAGALGAGSSGALEAARRELSA